MRSSTTSYGSLFSASGDRRLVDALDWRLPLAFSRRLSDTDTFAARDKHAAHQEKRGVRDVRGPLHAHG
jgi:hypothetical protein